MKNLYKISLLFVLGLFFISCEEEEDLTNNRLQNEQYVYLSRVNPAVLGEASVVNTSEDGEQNTSARQAKFRVERTGADISSALEVRIAVTSSFASDTDFQNEGDPATGTFELDFDEVVVIPAGSPSTSFVVTAINDVLSSGDKVLSISIESVSDASYSIGFPGEEASLASQTLVIQDDDCPIDILGEWEGTYALSEEFTAGTNEGFSFGFATIVTLTFDPSNPAGTAAFLGTDEDSPAGDDYFLENTGLTFNTCPGTLSLASDPQFLAWNVNGAQAGLDELEFTYNEDSKTLTFVANCVNAAGSNFGEYTVTLSKINE